MNKHLVDFEAIKKISSRIIPKKANTSLLQTNVTLNDLKEDVDSSQEFTLQDSYSPSTPKLTVVLPTMLDMKPSLHYASAPRPYF